MQYKSDLRWLLLILIPFLVLLLLQVLVPLLIKASNFGLIQQNYNYNLVNSQQNLIRSKHLANRRVVDSLFRQYIRDLQTFLQMQREGQKSFINIQSNVSDIINGHQLVANMLGSVAQQNASMWFSTNVGAASELPACLYQTLAEYLKVEPFIKCALAQRSNQIIDSAIFYYVLNNQSLYVQYPAQPLQRFLQLDSPSLDQLYYQIIDYNKTITVAFNQGQNGKNQDLLQLCKTVLPSVVACLRLHLQPIRSLIFQATTLLNQPNQQPSTFILINVGTENGSSPSKTIQIGGSTQEKLPILPEYLDAIGSEIDLSASCLSKNVCGEALYVVRNNLTLSFISPITDDQGNVLLYLLTQSQQNGQNFFSEATVRSFKGIIIPISLLITGASLLSIWIVKKVIDSIEKTLHNLNACCGHIAEGDTGVEIADLVGAEEIREIYRSSKIINKLHRYTDQNYFSGHFSQKILKYHEALQLIKKLKYDPGNLLENIGECYTFLQEWDFSIRFLKESVDFILQIIETQYGDFDRIIARKVKRRSMPLHYREMELILIRRLFKLNCALGKFLELKLMHQKKAEIQDEQKNKKYAQLFVSNTGLIKRAFYPLYSRYAESIITLFWESKHHSTKNQHEKALMLENQAAHCLKIYSKNFSKVTKLMKQKGSNNKLFFKSNKLTINSRAPPEVIGMFHTFLKVKRINLTEPSPQKLYHILSIFLQTHCQQSQP